ncbi:molybdate ABC transporter substrate-binding protein [Blastococcus sp. VKM Ac-2987]|uniref:molybdate ABC transporter substrate-binding protein n=1 Tax=Blastococcus sp. VKM Ac-2987 TaxID=3004141 RepID=UPI0022ABBF57|nr:molybdate ABC transporter substrate-binding protein [Blastococcus sp. VKM Ac-2987]MCZ2858932.1 molybdate ABC transporter substrate-binding protein [Blastococcus sp. VKM Ac-2987]
MRWRSGALLVAGLVLGGCGSAAGDAPPGVAEGGPAGPGDPGMTGTLTVLAAASLTDVFADLEEQLEAANPQLEVRFSFAGSSTLAAQVLQGAPADVLATADEAQMARVADAGQVADPAVFAENPLVLVVPAGNPAGIDLPAGGDGVPGLADLLPADLTLAVCAPEVPCGAAAEEVLAASRTPAAPDTYEDDVRAVLTKVVLGEVDAGLVYRSDVRAAGDDVRAFDFRESSAAVNRYPIGVLEGAGNPVAAQAFVDLVRSAEGQQALADAGFSPPS